jgi:hypothetical protein
MQVVQMLHLQAASTAEDAPPLQHALLGYSRESSKHQQHHIDSCSRRK